MAAVLRYRCFFFIGILLEIDPSVLTSKLVIEPSRDGLLFPHIYGVINKSAIVHVEEKVLNC